MAPVPGFTNCGGTRFSSSLLKNVESVIPNGVREVRNLSFLGISVEEGFLASLGMTAKRIFQQPAKESSHEYPTFRFPNSSLFFSENC